MSFASLAALSSLFSFSRIEVHGLAGFPSTVMDGIRKLSKLTGAHYEFHVKDYAAVCPRLMLIHANGLYCGEKGEKQCTLCLADKNYPPPVLHPDLLPNISISRWRKLYECFLRDADRVVCASQDAEKRIRRHIPLVVKKITRSQSPSAPRLAIAKRSNNDKKPGPLNIAVIGGGSYASGNDLLVRCAQDAVVRDLPLFFHLITHSPEDYLSVLPNVRTHTLPESEHTQLEVDGTFLPSLHPGPDCPELTSAITKAIPSFAFQLGAQNEILRQSTFGHALPTHLMNSPAAINDRLIKALGGPQRPLLSVFGLGRKDVIRPAAFRFRVLCASGRKSETGNGQTSSLLPNRLERGI